MDRRALVEKSLKDANTLPAGPAVMARIGELCRDPRASARDLGKVIQLDTALTNRVLKQVNSAFYGLSATIRTVTHAVVILGFQEVRHIAMSVPVANLFEEHSGDPGLDIGGLWEQCLGSACVGRALSYHIWHPVPGQVFVTGILAETGMVILNSILADEYRAVVEACPDQDFLPQVEESEIGISHIEVGRRLAEKWHFPADLVQGIGSHHHPIVDGEVPTMAGLVYAGQRFYRRFAAEDDPVNELTELPPQLVEAFQLTPEAVQIAFDKAETELAEAKQILAPE